MSDKSNTNIDNQQPSSGRAMMDSVEGNVRGGIAHLTGNPHDATAAQEKKDKAQSEWDASHAKTKIGPVSATGSGIHVDNQDRREGQWKETIGSAKESAGSLAGSKNLQQEGRNQAQEGHSQTTTGEATDWIHGATDRLRGSVNAATAALFGNKEDQQKNQDIHDQGKAAQRSVE